MRILSRAPMKKIKIDKKKLHKLTPSKNHFLSLASSIIYQQISTEAGNSIYRKFLSLFGGKNPTPKYFLKFSTLELKSAGLSPQKMNYLKDLAEKFSNQTLDSKKILKMADHEIKKHLMQVKGIGPWTVDMFLIFALNRRDVLPTGDLGIKKGFQKAFKLKKLPNEKKMEKLAEPHKKERTFLTLHLWQMLDKK